MPTYPETPFERAVDRVIADENRRFLHDVQAQERARRDGDLYRERMDAERLAAQRFLVDENANEGVYRYEVFRLLPDLDPTARTFLVAFVTGGVNGKSADDTAIGNLADFSEHHAVPGTFVLYRCNSVNDPMWRSGGVRLATAEHGIVWSAT